MFRCLFAWQREWTLHHRDTSHRRTETVRCILCAPFLVLGSVSHVHVVVICLWISPQEYDIPRYPLVSLLGKPGTIRRFSSIRFLDKTGRTGSTLQLINGIVLLAAFASVRLVWGGLMVSFL